MYTATVSQSPFTIYPQTDVPIDPAVEWHNDLVLDWQYDLPVGSEWEHTEAWSGDPELHGIATSHLPACPAECTPSRVWAVYQDPLIEGQSTAQGVARQARLWVAVRLPQQGDWSWDREDPSRAVEDAWCVLCRGKGDCFAQAALAAQVCKITGVDATPGRAYPNPTWEIADPNTPWMDQETCWDPYWSQHGHGANAVGYDSAGSHNSFEGYFEAAGLYLTVFPVNEYDSLAEMITSVSSRFFCVEDRPDPLPDLGHFHGEVIDGIEHNLPEPSPQ